MVSTDGHLGVVNISLKVMCGSILRTFTSLEHNSDNEKLLLIDRFDLKHLPS